MSGGNSNPYRAAPLAPGGEFLSGAVALTGDVETLPEVAAVIVEFRSRENNDPITFLAPGAAPDADGRRLLGGEVAGPYALADLSLVAVRADTAGNVLEYTITRG